MEALLEGGMSVPLRMGLRAGRRWQDTGTDSTRVLHSVAASCQPGWWEHGTGMGDTLLCCHLHLPSRHSSILGHRGATSAPRDCEMHWGHEEGAGAGMGQGQSKVGTAVVGCEAAEGTRRALLCHWGSVRAQSLWHSGCSLCNWSSLILRETMFTDRVLIDLTS